jgi:multiple antibiotic resistance protein
MPTSAVLQILESCLVVFTALFPIVNPLANAPIFLSLTPGYSSVARSTLATKVALNSFWLLTGSMLIGSHILEFFGISVPVVQIGGGMVVVSTGWMLLQREEPERESTQTKISTADIASRAFYPLTLPLTVGPGSISVAITLGANHAPHQENAERFAAAIFGPAIMAFTIFLSYRFAERLARLLGPTAMNVIVRLASFILVCIGVQILWNGIKALLALPR